MVMEGVEDLKTELESLKAAVRKIDRNPPEGQKVVFTPKQRKLEKYSGRPGEIYANVYEFVEEFQRVLRTRPTSTEEQVGGGGEGKSQMQISRGKEHSTKGSVRRESHCISTRGRNTYLTVCDSVKCSEINGLCEKCKIISLLSCIHLYCCYSSYFFLSPSLIIKSII